LSISCQEACGKSTAFIDENFRDGLPHGRKALRRFVRLKDPTGRPFGFAFGAYVGEVIRRGLGGQWAADDSDPYGVVNIELRLPTGVTILPVLRCAQRMSRGPGDSIAAYAEVLGLNVGLAPARPSRRTFGRAH
jgi:hypothetical protein